MDVAKLFIFFTLVVDDVGRRSVSGEERKKEIISFEVFDINKMPPSFIVVAVAVSVAAIKEAFISLAVMYFFPLSLLLVWRILKERDMLVIWAHKTKRRDEARIFSPLFVYVMCVFGTLLPPLRINECVDMVLLLLLPMLLSFCAGTFKVINDNFWEDD